jgi:hypothetical protein
VPIEGSLPSNGAWRLEGDLGEVEAVVARSDKRGTSRQGHQAARANRVSSGAEALTSPLSKVPPW